MKTCPSCHQALADDALFCPVDGTPLAAVENDPLLGSIIADRYVLLERIGQGNSGTIYRAEHVVLRQSIAVKLLHLQLSQDQGAVERFREEVTTLALLKSNSIVRGSDFGVTADGRIFFAMEYLKGETLAATLGREGRFKEGRALTLLEQIGNALAEAHTLGFVHRDIRPRNIFILPGEPHEQIKLLDFGLAKLVAPQKGSTLTAEVSIGDPRYMSPEQARGEVVDSRGDIYSLAVIAYEMVTGSPPFVGAGTLDVLTKHLEAQPVPISNKASDISAHFADAVAYALCKRAKDRYSTVTRFLDALAGRAPVEDPASESSRRKPRTTPSGSLPRVIPATRSTTAQAVVPPQQQLAADPPGATLIGTGVQAAEVLAQAKKQHQQQPQPMDTKHPAKSSKKVSRRAEAQALAPATVKAAEKGVPAPAVKVSEPAGKIAPNDFEERITEKIALHPPVDESKGITELASSAADRVSGSVDTSTPLALAPSSSPEREVPDPPESSVVVDADHPYSGERSSPEFSLSQIPQIEETPYREEQPSQSTNWFAEGLAAEKQLAKVTKSGPLPLIYSTMSDEEEVLPQRFTPVVVIGIVVGIAALVLLGFIFAYTGGNKAKPVAIATLPAAKKSETDLEVRSEFQGGSEAKPQAPALVPAPVPAPVPANPKEALAPAAIKPQAVALTEKDGDSNASERAPSSLVQPQAQPKVTPVQAQAQPKATPVRPQAQPKANPVKPRSNPAPHPDKVANKNKPEAKSGSLAKAEIRAGQNNLKRGDYAGAKQSFTKALQLDPHNTMAHAGLGELAFEQGNYAGATKHLQRALQYSPGSPRIIVMLGNSYFKQKKTKEAVAQYRKALKINPNNAAARAGLEAAIRRLAGS